MKILFVPARWPRQRDEAWRSLLKARAIENQIFVVGCNANDGEGGYSYAFDPLGRMIFSNRGKRESRFLTFSLSLHRLTQARALHSNLREAVLLHHLCA
jgi:predicted amidohydrolase